MIAPSGPVVMGVGNVLLRDDGVGVRVMEGLRRLASDDPSAVPAGTRMVDGGTLGLELLGTIAGAGALLLLDAVNVGGQAGAVSVLRGDAIGAAAGPRTGAKPGSIGELLGLARLMGWLPRAVSLVGVQVGDTRTGLGLSPRVEEALSEAVETARMELRALDERAAAGRPAMPVVRPQEEATA